GWVDPWARLEQSRASLLVRQRTGGAAAAQGHLVFARANLECVELAPAFARCAGRQTMPQRPGGRLLERQDMEESGGKPHALQRGRPKLHASALRPLRA